MANDKLLELTRQLYNEGLAKGRTEGEQILAKAREEAAGIVAAARAQAESIITEAEAEAEDALGKAQSDIKAACNQALQQTRNDLQNAILAKTVDQGCRELLTNEGFLKEIIMAVAGAFSLQSSVELGTILPRNVSAGITEYVEKEVSQAIGREIKVTPSKKITGGFIIQPKGEGYEVSFSDETFIDLIREYLRPVTRKVLFGE